MPEKTSEQLFDNAIKSMERAEDTSNAAMARYYIKESKGWLRLAMFARQSEFMESDE
jgi:energy-coupling factor transporter transmembrane protein EcfT